MGSRVEEGGGSSRSWVIQSVAMHEVDAGRDRATQEDQSCM
jgi:hypothetical protein